MINKQGIILEAMDLYRNQPLLRKGQCILIAVDMWHPNLGPIPEGYNCAHDDTRILDFLEWANWTHDLRNTG